MRSRKKPSKTALSISSVAMAAMAAAFLFAETTPVATSTSSIVETPAAPAQANPVVPVSSLSDSAAGAEFVGATTCLSCHEKQAGFKDSIHGHSFPEVKGIEFEKSCETCHGPGSRHAAAAGDRSNPGFSTIKVLKNLPARESNQSCQECHQDQNRMHWIGSRHEARGVSCIQCHSIHAPKAGAALLNEATVDKTCAKCHRDIANKVRRNSHMPIAEGKMSCSSCHNPHGSATPKMLKEDSNVTACQSCHADKRGPFVWEHAPVRENCMNCHDPHGSHHESMLIAKLPFLCQRCHIGQRHPATPYGRSDVTEGDNKIAGKSCQGCHSNVHGSNHPSGNFFLR